MSSKRSDVLDSAGRVRLADAPVLARAIITGDLCPQNRIERMLLAGDLAGVFGRASKLLAEADLTIVNLEAPLCRANRPIAKVGPNFRADPGVAKALADAGVDVCCLANNHVMDHGQAGLLETLGHLERTGLKGTGAARSQRAASRPLSLTVNTVRVAIINFAILEGAIWPAGAGAARWNVLAIRRAVAKAVGSHDIVLPILHAGKEEVLFPAPGLRELSRGLLDAGAAAVVAHHPHVVQGIELYHGRPIIYSLGNFLFDWPEPEPHTDSSFLLELGLSQRQIVSLAVHPLVKSRTGGAQLLAGQQRAGFVRFLNEISGPLTDEPLYLKLWRQQCRELFERHYAVRLERGANIRSADAAARLKAELTFLNLMQDDEHGEVLKEGLLLRATGRGRADSEARRMLARLNSRLTAFAGR